MRKHIETRVMKATLAALSVAVLVACGGGGGGTPAVTTPLSGTAAVGAALANATIILKGANGVTVTTTADDNGAYKFPDVSRLTAPYVLKAEGTVGGEARTMYSVLETAPAAGTQVVLNVTPATDAVIALVAGGNPASLFDNPAQLSTTALATAKQNLLTVLAPTLTALGLSTTTVDTLFTASFTANGSGLDKLLDVVSFSSSDSGSLAIADKSTGTTVTLSSSTTTPTPLSVDSTALTMDTSGIATLMTAFNNAVQNSTNWNNNASALLTETFQFNGANKTLFLAGAASEVGNFSVTSPTLDGCFKDTISNLDTCKVRFGLSYGGGYTESQMMYVVKNNTGTWQLDGNRRSYEFDFNHVALSNTPYTIYSDTKRRAADAPSENKGFNLHLTGNVPGQTNPVYQSAKLIYNVDYINNPSSWEPLSYFKLDATNCSGTDYMVVTTNVGGYVNCGNFVAVDDTTAKTLNAARLAGTLRLKVVAYTDANFSTGNAGEMFTPRADFFTTATAGSTRSSATFGINDQTLATNAVTFNGSPSSINFAVFTGQWGSQTKVGFGNLDAPDFNISTLNGSLTPAAAGVSTAGAYIPYVMMQGRDSSGRKVWKEYRVNNVTSPDPLAPTGGTGGQ